MEREILCLILGVLLVSFVGFVVAENNETETPSCDSDNLSLCLDETNCTNATGFWYNDECNAEEEPSCSNNLSLCLDETNCTDVGQGYWYDDVCNAEEEPSCINDLSLCLDATNCTDANGFWYDDVCNVEEEGEDNGLGGVHKTKIRGEKITFIPWQKRNASECLDVCKCVGAVVLCTTTTGKTITIEAGRSGNVITITIGKTTVDTELELEQEETESGNETILKAKLSNGRSAEIKIMPDTASEKALNKLRIGNCSEENNCQIELKEIGKSAEERQLAYEMQIERHSRILGIFQKKMQVRAQVSAENEEAVKVNKPWWAFLATEPAEE